MKRVVIINGSGGSGKDTFVELCSSFVSCKSISSVRLIKIVARGMGWDGSKDEKSRKFLSDIKTISSAYNDLPFEDMRREVASFTEDGEEEILFLHIREPEEVERAAKEFDATTLLIVRDNIAPITSNYADANVGNYKYDYVVENSGDIQHDLLLKAKAFVYLMTRKEVEDE